MKKIVVCLDDKNGMLFNKRRQSQDKVLREDLLEHLKQNENLYMNEYSYKQFKEISDERIKVSEDFINDSLESDWCFVENISINENIEISELIIYKWNRTYPADLWFSYPLEKMKLIEMREFVGKSHEKISMEKYIVD